MSKMEKTTVEEEEEREPKPSLFPLSSSNNNNNNNNNPSSSSNPNWLSNSSFTTDLSVIHNKTPTTTNPFEDESLDVEDVDVPPPQPSYAPLSSSSEESLEEKTRKRRRKKKSSSSSSRKRGREELSLGSENFFNAERKSSVRAWAGAETKQAKDYYFDSNGDRDNLVFGSLYRMDVARYKPLKPVDLSGYHFQALKRRRNSLFDGDEDTDVLDGKLRSGGRYWSTKYAVLERHKELKHVRIVSSRVISNSVEFVSFSERGESGSQENTTALVEESWEDELLRRTREFNKLSRESPHDETVWLAFAEFQDKIANKQPQKGARLQTLEKKISILEKASELNPDNEELLLCLMKAYQSRDTTDVLMERWEKILVKHSGSGTLWREFMRVLQGDFSRFKVSYVRKMFAHAIQALSAARGKLFRQVHQTTKSSFVDSSIIQLELGLVDTFVSLCRLEWQSGYQELATGLFQAEIEYNLFCPSLLLTDQSKQTLFEHFWNGNAARVGEDGALGWSTWLEKEEESSLKAINEDSSQENEGGWTGWSELLLKNNEPCKEQDLVEGNMEDPHEDLDAEDTKQEDDVEYLLSKLGIDVDAEADHEVKDTTTWIRWSEEELSRDCEQWMPVHDKSAIGAIDDAPGLEGDEQLLRVILLEDVSEYLFSLCSNEARFSLVSQFIDFFGGMVSQRDCTNSPSWKENTLSLEKLPDYILNDLRKVHELMTGMQISSTNFSSDCLIWSSNDISSRVTMMEFLRNAILLCLTAFPRNHILEEAVLVAEELFTTKMKSHTCAVTPSRALAKCLLKNDRQGSWPSGGCDPPPREESWVRNIGEVDLLLCGVYARREASFGNIELARRVFDMALSSIEGLSLDLQSNTSLLYYWYAEMELSNCSGSASDTASSRALHILSCFGSSVKFSAFKCPPSSVQLLRARQGFKERIRTLRSVWARGDINDQSVALICAAALFEDLTTGAVAAIGVLEEAFSMVLPERRSQSSQLETLFNYYIKMLQKHYNQSKLSIIWESILQGLQIYPSNPSLFASFIEIGSRHTVPNKLRWIFDEYFNKKPSLVGLLFSLSFELGKEGSQHRLHALFERGLENDKLRNSVILWRCYIAYLINVACDPSAARRIFFRAIYSCPWSKKLWLDGFLKLKSVLTAKEMSDLLEVMREKELNIRTDIYEILLQDEINPGTLPPNTL
ncbi:hypothetical protein GIB67_005240 [Kingdonia uniflora]|uniref:Protein NRDE2 homolog n=1 Tax=Kingdonia uniflora TaxID=39325 RepID=A0A7J7NNX5_9MAGN|nr:hypothetical protein GIB67_005240 [Kingdonia uniflora]